MMIRLLLVILLISSVYIFSYGQKPKGKEPNPATIAYFGNSNPFRDTAFISNIAKVYGDSISAVVDSMAKDTLFVKRLDSAYLWASGEFISSTYRIEMPIKYLNCTSDYEHIFSKDQISELNKIMQNFKKETSVDIAIVTIDSSFTTKSNFDNLIATVHDNWAAKEKNKSHSILIAVSKGLKSVRIDNGQSISEKLSNRKTKEIIDNIFIPQFRQGQFFEGIKSGLLTIMKVLR